MGATLTCLNGLYCGIAPGPASEAYGLKDASFEIVQMIKVASLPSQHSPASPRSVTSRSLRRTLTRRLSLLHIACPIRISSQSLGYTFAGIAILALAMLKGVPFSTAFGWSNLPWLLLSLDNIWNGTAEKMGQ